MRLRFLTSILLALLPFSVGAQEMDWGSLSGGLESQSIWYRDGKFRSNNYLKLDYVRGRFSAGVQAEYYPEPLLGYDVGFKGVGLPGKYLAWTDKTWGITAGDFCDQFGTGIIFRSWEDRALARNNSLGGVRRQHLWYGPHKLAGAQAALHLGKWDLEGSTVYRHGEGLWWQAGGAYASGSFSARAEYVGKRGGNAQTLELGYSRGRLSLALDLRRLQRMIPLVLGTAEFFDNPREMRHVLRIQFKGRQLKKDNKASSCVIQSQNCADRNHCKSGRRWR